MSKLPILWIKQNDFDNLLEYSSSYPTGTTISKRWKRDTNPKQFPNTKPNWTVGEYVKHKDPKLVGIKWWRPIITNRILERTD